VAIAGVVPALAACSSGGGSATGSPSQSADARLASAGTTLQNQIAQYQSTVTGCKTASSPVVCVEKADRTLGDQVHDYANVLAVGHGFTAPPTALSKATEAAQTLANSLEILGDAEPTQSNYNQVLNTFDVNGAIAQLQGDVSALRSHGG
jgi:hypothetical protein